MDRLTRLQTLVGCSDADKNGLMLILLDNAEQDFLERCNRADVPVTAESLIVDMAVVKYNRLSTEGLSAQSDSGASESYLPDYPDDIARRLTRYRKVRLL